MINKPLVFEPLKVYCSDFLKEEKVVQLSHPFYLPDLSLCNFFLFPILKKIIMNPKMHLVVQFKCLQGIPKKASAFTECIARLEKCVSVKAEYFKGLKMGLITSPVESQ